MRLYNNGYVHSFHKSDIALDTGSYLYHSLVVHDRVYAADISCLNTYCHGMWLDFDFLLHPDQVKFTFHEVTYNVMGFWYKVCLVPLFGDKGGSLVSALSLVVLMWAIGYILYRRKIYIKL